MQSRGILNFHFFRKKRIVDFLSEPYLASDGNSRQQNVYASLGLSVALKFCFLNFVQQRGTVTHFETQAVININVSNNALP